MNNFITSKSLTGLFPDHIIFPNLSAEDNIRLLRRELRAFDIDTLPFISVFTTPGYASLLRAFIDFQKTAKASWSNASEVKILAKEIARVVFKRLWCDCGCGP